ncbi:MAG: EAL domain-containing response regulator [Gammaproteobacteria bacterium]|nr:EAL domain-containing response regulator [Gammaproteobacteria bacterium]
MSESALAGMSALVVDDEELMRDFLCMAVQKSGVGSVSSANCGSDALDQIEESHKQIDIILCDLQMPEMDGIEVIRHLANDGYGGGIVLVSGEDKRVLKTAENMASVRGLNVIGSLSKPVPVHNIIALMNQYAVSEQKTSWSMPDVTADELDDAIRAGEIVAHYQPQIDIKTGRVKCAETLARWPHPERGMISPDIFIDMAERHDLIDALTDRIITQATVQGADWHRQGIDINVAINISMNNLRHLDFPDRLHDIVNNAGMDIKKLVIEITESQLVKDLGTCLDILTRLRLKGPTLSIDDFGTGYASMEHLKEMPFEELKIDRAFVNGACKDDTARAILESSIFLAKQLNMATVAEGVETSNDWDLVTALGCDVIQGYYIAPPMDIETFNNWIKDK